MSKIEAYRAGLYMFTVPPVITNAWKEVDWINFIDSNGKWMVPVV
ncbi:hypothetical protein pEaSNUABM50_00006 [Erwinia phage pEa_SNUABM_50]|uniref:Uncharacterized protein n=4 Tax=Eneladusvirus BF TaxID=2560751 RepID=A0A7L8ZML6_9CAUD|nr:hypothetical protein FDH34_gp007 [Serratia phage BF]QOI70945.1 hypothetical protein pEaSNUABM12_00007 [Erwinia phage pEa_SNUABM_12]QOI71490.1 hypothetical protein pEaSNUABM47_00006 [Erwinia phage pEa_SNUABM_47]QOI72030.1 hypothetical protein pEaSNUABM50_00006 [Erwinia phage pEa_SNUABM_50]QXO11153.1 hypothetical protein pEaSNUABM19_00007 [Erwinia phage pEa_SNUABM_19]QXO11702.1 hypothetical protein pEaSNUABM44_00006 [Erwinia phage pEa_SNUABM_44]QXO12253.1 hypothetical protein pEaSNUABM49_000